MGVIGVAVYHPTNSVAAVLPGMASPGTSIRQSTAAPTA
jgi:hypothetical protein